MTRLNRHEKQAVRRFIRERARVENRAYRDQGTAVGVRSLIQRANKAMKQGHEARIAYPQDVGCGIRSVTQIINDAHVWGGA